MRRSILAFSTALWTYAAIALPANEELLVSTQWLQNHLGARRVTVVEIGDRSLYESGHIAGAKFIALSDLVVPRAWIPNELPEVPALQETLSAAGIPNRGRIILYSRDVIVASRAFFTLDYLGHGDQSSLLDGGFAKWAAESRPIESGPPPAVARANFQARPHPEAVVHLTALHVLLEQAQLRPLPLAIIDARPPAQFLGAEPGPDVVCGGHIPLAINVPWPANLTAAAIPLFRSSDELRELYRHAGLADHASVITYCRTGMQASVTYFVMRYLGREVHLYDGSYVEWSRDEYGPTGFDR